MKIGKIEIIYISDGTVHVDAGGPFGLIPRALYKSILEPDPNNLIPMTLYSLYIQVNGKKIIVDTGLGNKLDDKLKRQWNLIRPYGTLIEGLMRLGVYPADIDMVINTHLHSDHCAGNTYFTMTGSGVAPTFPNAVYFAPQREYEDATHPNERTRNTYFDVNFQPLIDNGQMHLIQGQCELLPGVFSIPTPGHTAGHTSILLESEGQHALFVADLASYAVHFERLNWMTAYDVEPLITLETKRHWQKWAIENKALLLFQHDPKVTAGILMEERERRRIEPLSIEIA